MASLKSRFLLSLNDHPNVLSICGRFHLTEVQTTYSIGSKKMVEEAGRGDRIIENFKFNA